MADQTEKHQGMGKPAEVPQTATGALHSLDDYTYSPELVDSIRGRSDKLIVLGLVKVPPGTNTPFSRL